MRHSNQPRTARAVGVSATGPATVAAMVQVPEPDRPPLVPFRWRRAAVGLVVLCATSAVVLGIRYHGDTAAGRLDAWAIDHLPWAVSSTSPVANALADAISPWVDAVVAGVLAVAFAARRQWKWLVLTLAGPALTGAITESAKHLVDRTINGGLALPSGHTAGATSILVILALAVLTRVRAHVVPAGVVAALAVTAGAAGVGLIMVSLDAHYPTDVVAGFCTAVVLTLGTALLLDVSRPAAPARPSAPGGRTGR